MGREKRKPLEIISQTILIAFFAMFITACGGSSSGDNGNGEPTNGQQTDDQVNGEETNGEETNEGDTVAASDLLGTWQSECHLTPQGNDNIIIRTFDDQTTDVTIEVFQSQNGTCSGEPTSIDFVYSYQVGAEVVTQNGVTARELDAVLEEDPQGVNVGSDQIFDIFHIDSNDTLYFAADAASTAAERPNDLNFEVAFHRQ